MPDSVVPCRLGQNLARVKPQRPTNPGLEPSNLEHRGTARGAAETHAVSLLARRSLKLARWFVRPCYSRVRADMARIRAP